MDMGQEKVGEFIRIVEGGHDNSLFDVVAPIQSVSPERHKELGIVRIFTAQRKCD